MSYPDWQPLAERMRPQGIDDFVGQQHLLGKNQPLRLAIEQDQLHSLILWGPPGSGKTTLARILARKHAQISLSAVMAGVKDIRAAVSKAEQWREQGKAMLLFIDEVHRFNKSQQDALLPYIEEGTFIFIGATTENPSFELNNALLSRVRVYVLKPLTEAQLDILLQRCLADYSKRNKIWIQAQNLNTKLLFQACQGDARRLYNFLDQILAQALLVIDKKQSLYDFDPVLITQILTQTHHGSHFDKGGDAWYDQISAFHKSVRGSSPDGALYWMARIIQAGGDPLYIARRLLAIASEDIGNADPRAMMVALNAWDAWHRLGPQEGNRAIAQAAVYCAMAPKSNAVYTAFKQAMQQAKQTGDLPVPSHLRNAPTALMKNLGYGAAYRYAHDEPDAFSAGQKYFPDILGEQEYYHPVKRGLEIKIAEKLEKLREQNKNWNHST